MLFRSTDDLASYITAADLVVSMGGYNTIGEILSLQRRAIVVPRIDPVEEQWIRARRMAALGLFTTIHPDQLTVPHLTQTLSQELRAHLPAPGYLLDFNALPHITAALLGLVHAPPRQPALVA